MSLLYSEVLRSGLELAEFFNQSKLILSSNSTGIIPMDGDTSLYCCHLHTNVEGREEKDRCFKVSYGSCN